MSTEYLANSADFLKPSAEALPVLTMVVALLLLGVFLPALVAPARVMQHWLAFPRSIWPGRILTIIVLVWTALWLQAMPLGPMTPLKKYLPLLTPAAILAVWFWVDDLLPCRALGGLLVLIPTPLLSAAQWHPSSWRIVVLVAAYIAAIIGMVLIAIPYRGRDLIILATASPGRLRLTAAVFLLPAVFLLALAAIF